VLAEKRSGSRARAEPTVLSELGAHMPDRAQAQLVMYRSSVARQLSMRGGAGAVSVLATNGMKYYAVNAGRLKRLAESLDHLAE